MAKKKRADELTTDEAMNRVFGKGSAKKLRELVERLDAAKGPKPKKTTRENGSD